MKSVFRNILVVGMLFFGIAGSSFAAGTASNTTISNQATVNYQVSSTPQTAINSNTTTFKVDNKIILTVSTNDGSGGVTVYPGKTGAVLTFTVTNTGNTVQDYSLAAVALNGATVLTKVDNFDLIVAPSVFVDANANGTYESGTDTGTFIDELATDASITVFIVGDIQLGRANGDAAGYALVATTKAGGSAGGSVGAAVTQTAGADNPAVVDIVFADGAGTDDSARDAQYSSRSIYFVSAANLTVTKTTTVESDPINITTNPKAIPGAVIKHSITVSNGAGGATATAISVTDNINTEITAGTIAFSTNAYASGKGITITAPNLYSGAATELTNASDADEGTFGSNTVTVTDISLTAGQSATVEFKVIIQ